jgi:predicted dehydrogenase
MSSKYKVVVVGMGKRGTHHAQAFQANGRFEVVGLCDVNRARLHAAAAKFGPPGARTRSRLHWKRSPTSSAPVPFRICAAK